ncbi:MAG: hypothetical protein F9K30_21545 [Dechloromonas sp.]|jgi:hypothetical protein|nr:MAG: hypothetical protein F9K30_21545 [Dechloromonas sp.]
MIIAKIKRKVIASKTAGSELAYVVRLTRYITRADPADLRKLAGYGDDEYVRDLVRYVVAEGRAEEVLATGSRNLLGRTLEDQQAEMLALMRRCANPAGAMDHWVFSWPEGEEPSVDEINKTIDIFLRCQKLERCPVVWGYHGDTSNRHVHLSVLRIDRRTAKRQTAGDGWDIDTAQRAKAVIEHAFPAWKREKGSRYEVIAGMLLHKQSGTEIGPADKPHLWGKPASGSKTRQANNGKPADIAHKLDQKSRDYEEQTGFKSGTRVALEIAVPIALRSSNWDECHRLLAAEGIALQKTRYGANFVIDGTPVKASVDRRTSFENLKKLYGGEDFVESRNKLAAQAPREMWPHDAKRREYYAAKRDHDESRKSILARFRAAHGRARGVDKAVLDAASAAASFPSFEAWASGATPADPVETIAAALGFAVFEVKTPRAPGGATVRPAEFRVIRLKDRVIYSRRSDPLGRPSFIDLGDRVVVNAAKDREAVRAALLLVVKNNPGCEIAALGDRAFKKLALEIAIEEGVALYGALGRKQALLHRKSENERTQGHRNEPLGPAIQQSSSPPISQGRPKSDVRGGPSQSQPSPVAQPGRPADHASGRDAMLVKISRLFHSGDWDPSEFLPETMLGKLSSGIASALRTFDEIRKNDPSSPSDLGAASADAADQQAQAAEAARRAAAIAAASRGF